MLAAEGGWAGVISLAHFNKALLGKWLWWFNREEGRLWSKVTMASHGADPFGWGPREGQSTNGVGLWKCISHGWDVFSKYT